MTACACEWINLGLALIFLEEEEARIDMHLIVALSESVYELNRTVNTHLNFHLWLWCLPASLF